MYPNRESSGPDPGQTEIIIDQRHPRAASEPRLSNDSPISYLYLTFDTVLPTPPTSQQLGLPESQQLPPCPDMRAYLSPLTWPLARKNLLLALSCIATFLTAYSAGSYSPPSVAMARDLNASHLATLVGITTFTLGFAFAPMALAPISEIWGRYPVFVAAGIVYVIFQAVCAVVTNLAGMLIARFLVGVGGSVFSSVVGGVIADLFNKEERNTPMALFSGFVLGGTGAGPLVGAAFVEALDDQTAAWKWTFWHQVIMDGVLVIAIVILFRESRASVLLSRKAKKLNQWYQDMETAGAYGLWVQEVEQVAFFNPKSSDTTLQADAVDVKYVSDQEQKPQSQLRRIRWVVQADEERESLAKLMTTSIQRPFYLLFKEPVVFCFSLWAAFSWGVLYLSFAVVPFLYSDNLAMSSRIYIAMMASAVVATVVGIVQEQLMKHPQWQAKSVDDTTRSNSWFWVLMRRRFPVDSPEARLYFACVTALLLPAGLFGAFLSPSRTYDYSIAIGIGFANWGIYSVYLATFNYLADTYHIYASSALAAQSFCRNVIGGAFPLLTGILFTNLGLRNAGILLGSIALFLSAVPWVLVFFGEKIRAKSSFAIVSDLEHVHVNDC